MDDFYPRWASLGVRIAGEINPWEDPEELIRISVERLHEEGRLPSILATWLRRYGDLLITRKIRFRGPRERRIFGALVEASGTKCKKLLRMIPSLHRGAREHLDPNVEDVLKERSQADPHPAFLRQGFWAKRSELVREKILLPPAGAFERSAILRARALMGASVRSDLIARMPGLAPLSMHQLARTLHVRQPTLQPIVRDLHSFGLVEVRGAGRAACLAWVGQNAVTHLT